MSRMLQMLLLWGIVLALPVPRLAHAQKAPADTIAGLKVPEGWEVTLFASEPEITNPTAIDVDAQGRVWVCEGQWYRYRAKDPPEDRVKVLQDTDHDGKADKVTVFADGLLVPMSVCVAGTKVYIGESPNLWEYEDKDGDGRADEGSKRALLTGFGGRNHDHAIHGLVVGPDHKLYMTQGDSGLDVTGPDGRHVKYRWGAMLRCNLDGTGLEAFAVNFRNPYELAVDSFGNVWISDNDNDGLKSVRICWILEGGDYGWFGHPENVRNPDGTFDPIHHWRADKPGFVPYMLITGFGSPSGIIFYESDVLGARYANSLIHMDPGPREIRAYHIRKQASAFSVEREDLITGDDDYFRPVDVCVAPDGSIYVADWYDGGVGGHDYNDPQRGRIYRIAPKGKTLRPLTKPGPFTDVASAVDGLRSPNLATQFLAREKLLTVDRAEALAALGKLVSGGDKTLKARALWLLAALKEHAAITAAASDADPDFRALAVRILRRIEPLPLPQLLKLVSDPDPQVRRELLLALRGQSAPEAHRALVHLINAWDGKDRFYLEAIHVAVQGRQDELFAALTEGRPVQMTPRMVALIEAMNLSNGSRLLMDGLAVSGLSPETAHALVDAVGRIQEPAAGEWVARAAANAQLPLDARRLALEKLRINLPRFWSSLREGPVLRQSLLAALKEPGLTREALARIGETQLGDLTGEVVALLNAAKEAEIRIAAIQTLGRLPSEESQRAVARMVPDQPAEVQAVAVRTLAGLRAFDAIKAFLADTKLPEDLRKDIVQQTAVHADGCYFLLTLIDADSLPEPYRGQAISLAVQHPDVNVRQLFAKYTVNQPRPETVAKLDPQKVLALTGDAKKGRRLFTRSAAGCTRCHRVGSEGTDIGPDLSAIGAKYGREALLDHIRRPAAGVAPEYVPHVVETENNGFLLGFIIQNTDELLELKTENGGRVKVPKEEVISIQKQEGTLMPELLLEFFGEQDVADLLAYLSSLKDK